MNRPALIATLLKIDNKRGEIVPFDFRKYPGQLHFHQNKAHRNIILKHRQGGWSSSILADMLMDCITIPQTSAAVVSHETRATQRLLDRVQFYYDSMEPPKPDMDASSRSEKRFSELGSSIYIGTAGARAFGRGDTIRKVLLSELAFYEDARAILNALEDAVPMEGELTIECTPNGEDNVFHEEWVKAREKRSPYKPFFYPWWWTPDYRIPKGSIYALPEDAGDLTFTPEEEELILRHKLDEEQIRWRRWKIAEKEGLFWQEFPEDELTCFITIGDPVFDPFVLTEMANGCYDGTLHPGGWTYWIPPLEGGSYVIGADSAAGAPGGSYSAAVVMDQQWRVCATFQKRIEPNAFANLLTELGTWYSDQKGHPALLAVERNFTGYAVLGLLERYGNIYYEHDHLTGRQTTKKGWWTNEQTKEYMRTKTREKLTQVKVFDLNLVRQLRGYRFIRHRATPQTFDDMAMALMLAIAVKSHEGVAKGFVGATPGWNW